MAGNEAQATLRIKTIMDSSDVISNVGQLQKRLQGLSLPKNLTAKAFKQMEELKDLTADYQNLISKPPRTKSDFIKVDQLREKVHGLGMELEKTLRDIDIGEIGTDDIHTEKLDKMRKELDDVKVSYRELLHSNSIFKAMFNDSGKAIGDLGKLEKAIKNVSSQKDKLKEVKIAIDTGDFTKAESLLKEVYSYIDGSRMKQENKDAAKGAINSLLPSVGQLKTQFTEANSEASEMFHTIQKLESSIGSEVSTETAKIAAGMKEVSEYTRQSNSAMDAYNNSVANSAKHQSEMSEQVQNLQNQVKNYFGLDEIFRRIGDLARDAMDTVKELDAAMTETAVVTNFSVSDMWERLPEYTANANALGSTIADVYNAATLYYQQGLNTNQAMDLANETLKMARIGGIEAAEATDMMTAALRGFNMELNQTSAQRINDVYSKLAAITAADTKEIGSAMERTASIANSANMDFETTSAFLAQMIETTREAPENLGTAMKSIVARFQELKEDPNTLVDSEGQALDYNRVDKALKSIGITLVDDNNQFRKLDDVFLEISSRWDGLSQAQQRYIATIAAGSRQQSRFIAMMQNYGRTMELVDASYSAEGAGQAQFEKTLESMSSKLNKLKNAWDQFVMGLMNSDFLKFGVDAGTKILGIIEKIIDGISKIGITDPFQGLIKSALTATTTFLGMLGAMKLLMAGIGKFAEVAIGKDAARGSSGIVGTAANYVAGSPEKQEEAEKQKEERKRIATINKQRTNALRTEFYATSQSTDGGFIKSMLAGRKAEKELSGFFKGTKSIGLDNFRNMFAHLGKDMQTELQKSGINKSLGKLFWTVAKNADLDDSSRAMAQKFAIGIARDLREDKITIPQAMQKMTEEAASKKYKDKTGKAVSLDLNSASIQLPKQTSGLQNASTAFDKIGTSAQRAGIGIQQFAMSMYGTPLQPFGMALNLVSNGLMLFGQSTSIVSSAMKAFQGAMILGNAATSLNTSSIIANEAARIAQAEGISIFTAAQKLATLGSTEGAAAAYAESLGLDAVGVAGFEAAAGEAAAAAGSKGVVAGIKTITATALSSPLMPFVAALMAIAAVGTAIYFAATKDARALEAQGDAAAQASQDLDTAKQALEAVSNDLEELANNDAALDGLIAGTTEWNTKLAEANAHILEMMGNYRALNEIDINTGEYKYIKTDSDGRMSITKEGQDAIKKQYQDAVNIATANSAIQGAKYNNLQDLNSKEYKENKVLINYQTGVNGYNKAGTTLRATNNTNIDDIERAKLENKNIEKQNAAREENAWKAGMHSLLSDAAITNSEATETILAKQNKQLIEEASENLKGLSKQDKKQRYAELSGYQYLGGDDYKDAQGNTITVDFKNIKEELPELEALSIGREKASEVDAALIDAQEKLKTGNGTTFDTEAEIEGSSNLIADVLSKSENADFDALKAFTEKNEEGKTGIESYIEQFSKEYNERDAKILEVLSGEEVTEDNYSAALEKYQKRLQTNTNEMVKHQEDAIAGAAGVLESSGWSDDQLDISNILHEMSSAQINMLNNTAESLSDNLSDKSAETYAKTVASLVDKGDTAGANKLQNIMSKADFTSPLSTLEAYNEAANSANKSVEKFGENWNKTSEAARNTSEALQEVYSSDDFAALSSDMEEYIKENDSLDGTKILQMAEDSQTLKRYLDATGGSAEGVAKAFTAISKGDLQLSSLTPGVVAAVNAMDKLANSAGRAKTAISELGMSFDSGDYKEFLSGQRDTLKEMIENGEYGNEGLEEVLKNAFGAKMWDKAYAEGESGIEKLYNKFNGLLDKNVSDLYEKGDTTESLLKKIRKKYKVTSDYADIMLQAATNTDINLKKKLETSNPKEMRKEYFKTVGIKNKKGKYVSDDEKAGFGSRAEIATQAMLYAPDDIKKQRKYIKGFAKDLGVLGEEIKTESGETITLEKGLKKAKNAKEMSKLVAQASDRISNFTEESSGKKVNKEIQKDWEARGFGGEWWKQGTTNESGGYDLQKITNKALGYGATDSQAQEIAYKAAKDSIKNGEQVSIGGQELTKEDVVDYNTFLSKQQELLDNEKWVTVGDTLGERIVAAWNNAKIKDKEAKATKEATKSTDKWNEGGQISEKSKLFEWLTTTGTGQMVTTRLDKMDETNLQRNNRSLVTKTIDEIGKSGVEMAQSTRKGMWANMINRTGGEGLAYGATGDAGKIKEHSKEYSKELSANLFDKDEGKLTGSIDKLVNQMTADSLNNGTKSNMMNQYLSQFQQQYKDLKPEAQAEAIKNLTETLDDKGFDADAIAKAIESLSGGTEKEGKTFEMKDKDGQVNVDLNKDSPLMKKLNKLEGTINITSITYGGKPLSELHSKASGQNNPNSAFHRTGTMARGSQNHGYTIPGQPTLTGEEGPEVVWEPKQNSAYIVGEHGPQFANISKNATVWNAKQTQQIKKNSKGARHLGTNAKGMRQIGTFANTKLGSGGSGGAQINFNATADIVGIKPDPLPINAKPNLVVDEEKGGIKGFISKIFGGNKDEKTIHLKGEVKKKDLRLPKDAKIKLGIKVTGKKDVTAATSAINKLKQTSGSKVKVNVKSSGGVNEGAISSSIANAGRAGSARLQKSLESAGKQASFSGVSSGIARAGRSGANSVENSLSGISATASITPKLTKSSLSVKGNKGGSATVSLYWSGAQGFNNYKLGSYAKGKRRNQSGAALTGEEGPEMAWYPRQQKAELLGVGGPQFVNSLPKDAVVWTAQQTKEIMKRKGIPVDSQASGTPNQMINKFYNSKKKTNRNFLEFGTYNKVFNLTQKIENLSNKIDKRLDSINKKLEKIGVTYKDIRGDVQKQLADLTKSAAANKRLVNIYKSRLKTLDKSKKKTKIEYKSGKKGKKTKKEPVELGKYITVDPVTGEYIINNNAIKKVKNKKKRQAIEEKAQEKIESYTSKRNSAQQDYDSQKKEIEELAESISESFYRWENELTKIYNITKKLEQIESRGSRLDASEELRKAIESNADLASDPEIGGFLSSVGILNAQLENSANKLKQQTAAIDANKVELDNLLNDETLKDNIKTAKDRVASAKTNKDKSVEQKNLEYAKEQLKTYNLSLKYLRYTRLKDGTYDLTIDYAHLERDKDAKLINTPTYEKIKAYVEKVYDAQSSLQEAYVQQTQSLTELYNSLTELQQNWSDMGHELLDYSEAAEQEEIDKLDTLNNSINEGFNKLIDRVRKELERQRRAEENQKTEEDISDKMNRLAMLRADTSGSNAAEIATLEKEIQDASESYEDSLEDQLLDRISDQAEEASEQRERQIELLKQQLDYDKTSGALADKVETWMASPEEHKSEIYDLWLKNQKNLNPNFSPDSDVIKNQWSQYWKNLTENREKVESTKEAIKGTTSAIQKLSISITKLAESLGNLTIQTGTLNELEQSITENEDIISNIKDYLDAGGDPVTAASAIMGSDGGSVAEAKIGLEAGIKYGDMKTAGFTDSILAKAGYKEASKAMIAEYNKTIATVAKDKKLTKEEFLKVKEAANKLGYTADKYMLDLAKRKELTWKDVIQAAKDISSKYRIAKTFSGDSFIKGFNSVYGKDAYKEIQKEKEYKNAQRYGTSGSANSTGSTKPSGSTSKAEAAKIAEYNKAVDAATKDKELTKEEFLKVKKIANEAGYTAKTYMQDLANKKGIVWKEVIKAAKAANFDKYRIAKTFSGDSFIKGFNSVYGKNAYQEIKKKKDYKNAKSYATGGLANYTGPAWLDGTTSKPELVLNATDTKNFLALKEALSDTNKGVNNDYSKNIGDTNIEVNINVDSINSDYDVDKITERVKRNIVQDARSRNVNIVTRRR